eukprot:TRINITY_DN5398_c0_g2_i2.p1 TRINITY_DN5398_c0_g2~~TRINITY_DN5398_c0_g2_i2.p1  ORF type:complete len:173 (-),score=38.07 TRINITY_DN5398_c0_g2_i2:144-662(-)
MCNSYSLLGDSCSIIDETIDFSKDGQISQFLRKLLQVVSTRHPPVGKTPIDIFESRTRSVPLSAITPQVHPFMYSLQDQGLIRLGESPYGMTLVGFASALVYYDLVGRCAGITATQAAALHYPFGMFQQPAELVDTLVVQSGLDFPLLSTTTISSTPPTTITTTTTTTNPVL